MFLFGLNIVANKLMSFISTIMFQRVNHVCRLLCLACAAWLLPLLLLTAGCVSTTVKTTRLTPGPDAVETKAISVYQQGEAGPGNYEIMGVVSGTTDSGFAQGSLLKKIQAEAARMGADSLVGYQAGTVVTDNGGVVWASALAVRTLPDGQSAPPPKTDCIVAIPHTLLKENIATGGRAGKLDQAAREFARFYLAQKGYYAVLVEEPMPDPFEGNFQTMDAGGLAKYGGPTAGLVLGIRFVQKSGATVILFSAAGMKLETSLYSKSQKKVTWQNTAAGWGETGWIINLSTPDEKRLMAIQEALNKTFETLPDLSTKTE